MSMPRLRGLVLAGGMSERMGVDKAALSVGGRSLLARAVEAVQAATDDVYVAVRPEQASDALRRRYALLLDVAPGLGPAAGLLAAAARHPDAAWLVIACDMPALGADELGRLVAARDPARGGTAWRNPADARPEPLCAIWEPATLARLAAEARAAAGGPVSPRAVLEAANPLLLNLDAPAALASVNTPDDLHRYVEAQHGNKP